MARKIKPELSFLINAGAGATAIPANSRILYVRGEADGKDTYDFVVTFLHWDGGVGAVGQGSIKYAGQRNGRKVSVASDFPFYSTSGVPAARGDISVTVTPGTGVSLQVYYLQGVVAV